LHWATTRVWQVVMSPYSNVIDAGEHDWYFWHAVFAASVQA
jgi:hypothetical protein